MGLCYSCDVDSYSSHYDKHCDDYCSYDDQNKINYPNDSSILPTYKPYYTTYTISPNDNVQQYNNISNDIYGSAPPYDQSTSS